MSDDGQTTNDQIPGVGKLTELAIGLNDSLQAIDHHHLIPVDTEDKATAYGKLAASIQSKLLIAEKILTACDHADRARGEAMLLLGKIFLELKPREGKGLLTHGQVGEWQEKHGVKKTYWDDARKFAEAGFSRQQARELGWRGMNSELAMRKGGDNQKSGRNPTPREFNAFLDAGALLKSAGDHFEKGKNALAELVEKLPADKTLRSDPEAGAKLLDVVEIKITTLKTQYFDDVLPTLLASCRDNIRRPAA